MQPDSSMNQKQASEMHNPRSVRFIECVGHWSTSVSSVCFIVYEVSPRPQQMWSNASDKVLKVSGPMRSEGWNTTCRSTNTKAEETEEENEWTAGATGRGLGELVLAAEWEGRLGYRERIGGARARGGG